MHSCIMNEHPPVRASRLCSLQSQNRFFFECISTPYVSRSRCTYVREVSPRLAEHLRYIMEKGNPVVYLSDCSLACGVGGGGGVDRGSW